MADVLPPFTDAQAYEALRTRDARFDGRFFVGVRSTGIYCRPVCRVRLPQARQCRFFAHAAGAEQAGFRPCLRCRPEQAPGLSRTDGGAVLVDAAVRQIQTQVDAGLPLRVGELADGLGVTERHLRRLFEAQLGVSPIDWWTTQRLLLAKRLLTDTDWRIVDVAAASGFESLRRFNSCFAERYRLTPSAVRASGARASTPGLTLSWRPPFDHEALLGFLAARAVRGLEERQGLVWRRTLALTWRGQPLRGWLSLTLQPERQRVLVQVAPGLAPALSLLLGRVRHLLDLDADPSALQLAPQGLPCPLRPGLRVPGSVCGFETTVRVILGQQISVAAATTLCHRLVAALGEPVDTPWPTLTHLFPSPQVLAGTDPERLGQLGIVRSRVAALQAMARAVVAGQLDLQPGAPLAPTLAALGELPGIGPWTTELVALRVLAWPDAFPVTDAGVLKALGGIKPAEAQPLAEAWRPWRAYAVMQLWQSLIPD